ncbi:MAG: hypothetical protein U1E73_05690 [Planctomycetota bacterium]
MRRDIRSFVLPLLLLGACSSAPAVQDEGLEGFAPAPLGETAMPSDSPMAMPAPKASPTVAREVAHEMTDMLAFSCNNAAGRHMELGIMVAYAVTPEQRGAAQLLVHENKPNATLQAQAVCDGVDFTDEDCLVDCEHKLMGRLGPALFGDGLAPAAQITRIVWARVLYR